MELSLETYINEQFDTLKPQFSGKKKKFTNVVILDLRLSLKKLSAVALLMEMLLPEKVKAEKLMGSLFPIYKKMGQLRDIQVIKSSLLNYGESMDLYFDRIHHLIDQKEKSYEFEVFDSMNDFHLKGKKKFLKKVNQIQNTLDKTDIVEIANENMQQLISSITRKLLSFKISEENYHNIRRSIKTIGYIIKLLAKDVEKNDLMIKSKWTKPIAQELGEWHDKVILRDFIVELMLNESEAEFLQEFERQEVQILFNRIEVESIHHLKLFRVHFDKLIIELEERL